MRNRVLRWGILGTGSIAKAFAEAIAESGAGDLVAVASREMKKAEQFAAAHGAAAAHAGYGSLLGDASVEAVYVALPHSLHAEWSIRAAEAGKGILCEKPLALNRAEAAAMVAAARKHGVFLMEGFMYRCHPQTARLLELVRSGVIGQVRLIQATFSFLTASSGRGRLLDPALGGGGILDVGCYPVSFARLVAGAAAGKPFAEPVEVSGAAVIGPFSGVDEYAVGTMRFEGGILASLTCGVSLSMENTARICGTEGSIVVPSPWFAGRTAGFSKILLFKGGIPEEFVVETPRSLYAIEAAHVAEHFAAKESPAMTLADSLGNMAALDRWRAAAGMEYPCEKPERLLLPAGGRPLARSRPDGVGRGAIQGLELPVSQLILLPGTGGTAPDAFAMFDAFFEKGGNAICLPPFVGADRVAKWLGHWVANRRVRNEVLLFARSSRQPFPTPAHFHAALATKLHELGPNPIDFFLADGDNPSLPVAEIVGALSAEVEAGRCKAYGLGNWTLERAREAVDFARANGLVPPSAINAAFSLARGDGANCTECVQWATAGCRAWLKLCQVPMIACRCRAQPFFAGADDPRCQMPEILARRDRARILADELGVAPEAVNLAWALQHPFPSFAMISPGRPEELDALFAATRIRIKPEQVEWLIGGA